MAVYLMQHGVALEKDLNPERPLTAFGKRDVVRIAAHFDRVGIRFSKILHSGKLRALQTAETLLEQMGGFDIDEITGLEPDDDVVAFAETLEDNVLYVGHLPHLNRLVSHLIINDAEAACTIDFHNASVVCLEQRESGGYQVEWFISPSICG